MLRRTVVTATLLGLLAPAVLATGSDADAATAKTPSLTLTTDHATYTAGAKAKISVHLGVPGGKVNLFRTYPGKSAHYLGTVKTDAKGNDTETLAVAYTQTFTATYSGSADGTSFTPTVSKNRTIKVRVKTANKLSGFYGTSGSYYLIHSGSRGKLNVNVAPNKTGEKLTFVLQALIGGTWHTKLTHSEAMAKVATGVSGAAVSFVYPKNVALRIRAQYAGDHTNSANVTAWRHVEFR